ncbi:MAG: putative ABC exporter domain-containing protein [Saccharofermentans sp.]|nr:putative ABC exporter domain-containing protein [Saccharofermentans sp.]
MLSPAAYKAVHSLKRRPVAIALGLIAFIWGIYSLKNMDIYSFRMMSRNNDLLVSIIEIVLIAAFDFGFILGNRLFPMNYSMADCTFHFSGPFTRFKVVMVPFGKAFLGMLFFLWFISCQALTLTVMFDMNIYDMFWMLGLCLVIMLIAYFLGVVLAVFFSEGNKYFITSYVFLGYHIILIITLLYMITSHFHVSVRDILNIKADELVIYLGHAWPARSFPFAGWASFIYEGHLGGNYIPFVLGSMAAVLLVGVFMALLIFGKYEYYDRACSMAQRANDFREARKAGVDLATTSLAVDARVGRETLKHGWGLSAIFHKHVFENIRTSRIFFVNQAAFLFRLVCAGFLLLARTSDGIEEYPHLMVTGAVAIIMVFNTVAFTGGRTILEFNRPFIYMIPEEPRQKLFVSVAAEIPEILFDSLLCGGILYIASPEVVTWKMVLAFVVLMISFDFFCEMLSLVCVRLFRKLGRYTLLVVKYAIIITIVSLTEGFSQLILPVFSKISGPMSWDLSTAAGYIVSAVIYGLVVLLLLRFARYMLERFDA